MGVVAYFTYFSKLFPFPRYFEDLFISVHRITWSYFFFIKLIGLPLFGCSVIYMAESEEELKSFLMSMKEESEKAGSKLTFKKLRSWHPVHPFMANKGEKSGSSDRFYFLELQNHHGW